MRVPLLDLSEQYRALATPIRQQIDEVLQSQRFILGPKVEQFERALCDYTGAKFAIGVSSGTDALLAVLMALEIGRGDAVITTPYHRRAQRAGGGHLPGGPWRPDHAGDRPGPVDPLPGRGHPHRGPQHPGRDR